MWFTMALLSAVLAGIRRSGEKRLLSKIDHFTLGWMVQLASLPVALIALWVTHGWLNPLHPGGGFWWPLMAVTVLFYSVNTWLFYKALRQGELSKLLPVQSSMLLLTMLLIMDIDPGSAIVAGSLEYRPNCTGSVCNQSQRHQLA